ncbi:transglutaminase family protein [Tellurirhabdus bombi]|uniref:transglutaminase family protein n=1 Tax=Tellurirhabdus bombi TaxID=2907205 RepID=UPI001F29F432|nr:transglutaminase family protein [Tellurirhabdus bombi]
MELHVRHRLRYDYSTPVKLEPHTLYLYPKIYPYQRLNSYELRIEPEPVKLVRNIDAEGNVQQIAYFEARAQALTVEVDMKVQSEPFNSFDFILYPFETQQLPFTYPEPQQKLLASYLVRHGVTSLVEQYARQVANEAQWQTIPFLTLLCSTIRDTFVYEIRDEGPAHEPEATLSNRKGTCRDYATLYIACCRSLGMAARFVSGYSFSNPQSVHELHAWVEVYLPEAGWRGFDPTEGNMVTNNHLYLAASLYHDQLAPLKGLISFQGKQVQSTMQASVEINQL